MINPDAVTAIATVALALIGLATLLYARSQLKDFRAEARVKHLIDLVNQFEREPMATYRRKLGGERTLSGKLQTLDFDNPPPGLHDVVNFFEHVGFLLDGNYLDFEGVSVEFHYWILHIWADSGTLIGHEQIDGHPIYYEYLDKMAKRLLKYDRPQTGRFDIPSEGEIEDFYLEEASLPTGSVRQTVMIKARTLSLGSSSPHVPEGSERTCSRRHPAHGARYHDPGGKPRRRI